MKKVLKWFKSIIRKKKNNCICRTNQLLKMIYVLEIRACRSSSIQSTATSLSKSKRKKVRRGGYNAAILLFLRDFTNQAYKFLWNLKGNCFFKITNPSKLNKNNHNIFFHITYLINQNPNKYLFIQPESIPIPNNNVRFTSNHSLKQGEKIT